MTKEEIIDNLEIYTIGRLNKARVYITVEELQKFIDEIKVLEQETKWIPTSERLPKTAGVYRVTKYPNSTLNSNYLVDACYFDGSDTWYSDNRINHGRPYANNVIAWQENPEPYKPESEE